MYLKERVVLNKMIGHPVHGLYMLVLSGPIASAAEPGQFVHIQVSETSAPLLRRPLSIAWINKEEEEITIYYRVQGKGTEILSQVKENEYLSVMGPLGTGFTIPQKGKLLLVAGGIGVFPLFSLLQKAARQKVEIQFIWGGENRSFIESAGLSHLDEYGIPYQVATLDGTMGKKGLVTDLLLPILEGGTGQENLMAAACGPDGMLRAVTQICGSRGIPLEVSLEERMACGIGACLGCVCTVKDEEENLKRMRVCKEGPVLKGEEVVWDAGI